jgi:hypothetical protein
MNTFRIALANLRFPASPEESVMLAEEAIFQASVERAEIICFPECFVPGYRAKNQQIPLPDPVFLDHAWSTIAAAAAKAALTDSHSWQFRSVQQQLRPYRRRSAPGGVALPNLTRVPAGGLRNRRPVEAKS